MSGWLSGKVKEVLSGDTVVIIPATAGSAPPPEKRLSLSSISSPKLGRRVPTSADEPFAFASREFLRRLVVGKTCVFRVDYKIDAANGREFGSVFLGEENVALSSVRNGFAKVREGGRRRAPSMSSWSRHKKRPSPRGSACTMTTRRPWRPASVTLARRTPRHF